MSTYIINTYNSLEEKYIYYVNKCFLSIGGVNKTFDLHTKKVTFAVIEPSPFNITFKIFDKAKAENKPLINTLIHPIIDLIKGSKK